MEEVIEERFVNEEDELLISEEEIQTILKTIEFEPLAVFPDLYTGACCFITSFPLYE